MVPQMVARVRILPVSAPNACSAAPPPSDEPMPAFALGRCMRTMSTMNKLRRTRATIPIPIRKSIRLRMGVGDTKGVGQYLLSPL